MGDPDQPGRRAKLVDLPGHEIDAHAGAGAGRSPAAILEHVLDILFREEAGRPPFAPAQAGAGDGVFPGAADPARRCPSTRSSRKLEDLRREVGGCRRRPAAEARAGKRRRAPAPADAAPAASTVGAARAAERRPPAARSGRRSGGRSLRAAWQQDRRSVVARSQPSLAANLEALQPAAARTPSGWRSLPPANHFASAMLQRDKNLALLKRGLRRDRSAAQPEVVVAAGDDAARRPDERRDRNQSAGQGDARTIRVVADAIEIFNGKLVDVQIRQEVDK
ncbi:MAG: hypothetical protein MZV70_63025 [Desulfobacterales bacterium]|nr:hypothetical protein [Desulfobacterales bacterium]